jgi:TIR domain-containing protein
MKELSGEYSAFVSYASENRKKAEDICASLEGHGFVCWIAPRDVRAGREYADEIIGGIERSGCVVLVLSQAANESPFVRREVERAVAKQRPVFPVRIEPVTPSPGLELFISGTHWIDAWAGNWDDHMDRLARDLVGGPVGKPASQGSSGHLPLPERRAFRGTYVAAGLVLLVALSGVAIWSLSEEAPRQTSEEQGSHPDEQRSKPPDQTPLRQDDDTVAGPTQGPSLPTRDQQVIPTPDVVTPTAPRSRPAVTRSRPDSRAAQTSQESTPSPGRAAVDPAPVALEKSRELNELRDDYDNLSIRGGAVDDSLNRLWEEMRPLSPRVDMATRQRSLKTYLTRSKEALTEKDAAGARRYLDIARADLEALEQFLGR